MGNFRTGSRIKLLFYDPLCQGKKGTTGDTKGFEVTVPGGGRLWLKPDENSEATGKKDRGDGII